MSEPAKDRGVLTVLAQLWKTPAQRRGAQLIGDSSTPPGGPGVTPLTAKGRSTRASLLSSAREVFRRDGFFEAKITDITKSAGVAAGSFYNYFRNKEEIFREVAMAAVDDLTAAPRRHGGEPHTDPRDEIEQSVRRYVEICRNYGRLTAAIQELSYADDELRRHREQRNADTAERGRRYIERLQASGLADPAVDARRTAAALQTMTVAVVYDHLARFDRADDVEHLVGTLTDIWARAIGLTG